MDGRMVQDFSQLRVLPPHHTNRPNCSKNRRSLVVDFGKEEQNKEEGTIRMDALVQDLNSALEESTRAVASGTKTKEVSNYDKHPPSGKRRVWRRRCKSTSNLAAIAQGTKVDRVPTSKMGSSNITAAAESSNAMATNQTNSDETGNFRLIK